MRLSNGLLYSQRPLQAILGLHQKSLAGSYDREDFAVLPDLYIVEGLRDLGMWNIS
jgi:hypothetical protein